MNTIRARYEVGIEDTSLEHFRLWSDASMRASAIGGYVYDRMARVGKPQLWQAVNGDLIVQSVRLPNTACSGRVDSSGSPELFPAEVSSSAKVTRQSTRR